MAVVSRIPRKTESKAKPGSVNEESKMGLTRRFLNRVGLGEDSSGSSDSDEENDNKSKLSEKKKKRARLEAKGSETANTWKQWNKSIALEQTMPSDAVLTDENAEKASSMGSISSFSVYFSVSPVSFCIVSGRFATRSIGCHYSGRCLGRIDRRRDFGRIRSQGC
jgi:hypothetical protein